MTRFFVVPSLLAALACSAITPTHITEIAGTWGGENAGLIVDQSDVHVHIGCTIGDAVGPIKPDADGRLDRKSTRLNSSHLVISYAVFCLKKKKTHNVRRMHSTRPRHRAEQYRT